MTTPTPELVALLELSAIADEMRSRMVNHGKSTSPTLVAWADRIDKAIEATRAATVPQGVVESDGFAVRYPDGSIEVTSIRKSEHASQWAQGFWPKMAAQGFTCVPVKITVATTPPAELGKGKES